MKQQAQEKVALAKKERQVTRMVAVEYGKAKGRAKHKVDQWMVDNPAPNNYPQDTTALVKYSELLVEEQKKASDLKDAAEKELKEVKQTLTATDPLRKEQEEASHRNLAAQEGLEKANQTPTAPDPIQQAEQKAEIAKMVYEKIEGYVAALDEFLSADRK